MSGGATPNGLYYDAENVLGGFVGGCNVIVTQITASMQLYAHTILVKHAYSMGGNTAETVEGVHMTSNGANGANAVTGTDDAVQLW
jgi:hypothetical protein